jgi:hypothetical protein
MVVRLASPLNVSPEEYAPEYSSHRVRKLSTGKSGRGGRVPSVLCAFILYEDKAVRETDGRWKLAERELGTPFRARFPPVTIAQ